MDIYLDCVRRSSWSTTTLDTLTKVLEAAKKYGDDAVEILKEDLKSSLECMEKQNYKKEEIFNTSLTQSCQNMIVVKLKSGSILLYAPVRMHKENPELILSWIESLGWVFTWGRTTNDVLIFEISAPGWLGQILSRLGDYDVFGRKIHTTGKWGISNSVWNFAIFAWYEF